MSKSFLSGEDCLDVIKDLSKSQGFYGRLYSAIMDTGEDTRQSAVDLMAEQKFTDAVDLIMWIEQ